jgi:hypothetical protein
MVITFCQPILSDINPDDSRPSTENKPVKPKAAAAAVGENPWSVANGTKCTETH